MDRVIDIIEKFIFCLFYACYCIFFVLLLLGIFTLPYIFWKLWVHDPLTAIPYSILVLFGGSMILLIVSTILKHLHSVLREYINGSKG